MIRVRFHGRGGHGAKTAARILGTAAFLEGWTVQDSPLYGAERRGAPVVAYARMAKEPILERGPIARPDLVLVSDDSLLTDPVARVTEGVESHTVVFLNTARSAEVLTGAGTIPGRLTSYDLTGLMLARFGKPGVLSAPLGAVAGRLAGLSLDVVRRAVTQELHGLHLAQSVIDRNLALAEDCFQAVAALPLQEPPPGRPAPRALWTPVYEPATRGTARIAMAGNTLLRRTGAWRLFRPVLHPEKCNGCTLCFAYCPDAAISLDDRDRPLIDYDHCKGCLLCVEECPTHALTAERERDVDRKS